MKCFERIIPNTYVRMLFVDFISGFNTVIPDKLILKLHNLGLPSSLCHWIRDFLTNRPQVVRIGDNTSSTLVLSTGTPQGCMFSPALFTVFTSDCSAIHSTNTIVKFADDTTIVGLISDNDETHYREEIQHLTQWCSNNQPCSEHQQDQGGGGLCLQPNTVQDVWHLPREHQDWQIRHWRPVLFTDESRFTLSTCDRCDRVWRRRGERSAACNILQHDRFGSGSVMVWGGISLGGRTALHVLARGSLTAIRYRDEILRPLVRPYAGAVGPGFLLMQDNARPHVAGVCQQFLQDEGIDAMDWPARSPDLNPIEHIWDIMSRSIHQRHVAPQTVQELADALVQVWEEIPSGDHPPPHQEHAQAF
ncbi:hypothetical protein L3Q82_019193 [Scortum barcoo]|uniref:Uncharacterized protein n=1 Tax=Scortum barcoo TaxID=214431 RepID=A0ACB8VGG8_9TELE|nr:hypothetical protein L3Q82_019193 [Scortum barcoo]